MRRILKHHRVDDVRSLRFWAFCILIWGLLPSAGFANATTQQDQETLQELRSDRREFFQALLTREFDVNDPHLEQKKFLNRTLVTKVLCRIESHSASEGCQRILKEIAARKTPQMMDFDVDPANAHTILQSLATILRITAKNLDPAVRRPLESALVLVGQALANRSWDTRQAEQIRAAIDLQEPWFQTFHSHPDLVAYEPLFLEILNWLEVQPAKPIYRILLDKRATTEAQSGPLIPNWKPDEVVAESILQTVGHPPHQCLLVAKGRTNEIICQDGQRIPPGLDVAMIFSTGHMLCPLTRNGQVRCFTKQGEEVHLPAIFNNPRAVFVDSTDRLMRPFGSICAEGSSEPRCWAGNSARYRLFEGSDVRFIPENWSIESHAVYVNSKVLRVSKPGTGTQPNIDQTDLLKSLATVEQAEGIQTLHRGPWWWVALTKSKKLYSFGLKAPYLGNREWLDPQFKHGDGTAQLEWPLHSSWGDDIGLLAMPNGSKCLFDSKKAECQPQAGLHLYSGSEAPSRIRIVFQNGCYLSYDLSYDSHYVCQGQAILKLDRVVHRIDEAPAALRRYVQKFGEDAKSSFPPGSKGTFTLCARGQNTVQCYDLATQKMAWFSLNARLRGNESYFCVEESSGREVVARCSDGQSELGKVKVEVSLPSIGDQQTQYPTKLGITIGNRGDKFSIFGTTYETTREKALPWVFRMQGHQIVELRSEWIQKDNDDAIQMSCALWDNGDRACSSFGGKTAYVPKFKNDNTYQPFKVSERTNRADPKKLGSVKVQGLDGELFLYFDQCDTQGCTGRYHSYMFGKQFKLALPWQRSEAGSSRMHRLNDSTICGLDENQVTCWTYKGSWAGSNLQIAVDQIATAKFTDIKQVDLKDKQITVLDRNGITFIGRIENGQLLPANNNVGQQNTPADLGEIDWIIAEETYTCAKNKKGLHCWGLWQATPE